VEQHAFAPAPERLEVPQQRIEPRGIGHDLPLEPDIVA